MSRILPILLIILPIISFFVSPEDMGKVPENGRGQLIYTLLRLPWYYKAISILIGVLWIGSSKKD
jgi:hypothetical protein